MKYRNKKTSKIIKFLNGKAFYTVVCICFICIGIAAWSGVEGFRQGNASETTPSVGDSGSKNETAELPPLQAPSKPQETVSKPSSFEQDSEETVTPSKPEAEETVAPIARFFINPVLGETVKGYSETELQYSMTMNDMRLHKGLDIAADEGAPVVAAGEGTVADVYKDTMLGTVVEIDHGNGITVKYCGLNAEPFVKKGDTVDSSKQIGTVGVIPSESVEQRHIHLEFYKNGKSVSPADYITK